MTFRHGGRPLATTPCWLCPCWLCPWRPRLGLAIPFQPDGSGGPLGAQGPRRGPWAGWAGPGPCPFDVISQGTHYSDLCCLFLPPPLRPRHAPATTVCLLWPVCLALRPRGSLHATGSGARKGRGQKTLAAPRTPRSLTRLEWLVFDLPVWFSSVVLRSTATALRAHCAGACPSGRCPRPAPPEINAVATIITGSLRSLPLPGESPAQGVGPQPASSPQPGPGPFPP